MLTDKAIGNKPGAVMSINPENADDIALRVLKRDLPDFLLPMTVINIDGEYELRFELTGNRFSYFNEKMMKKDYITLLKNLLLPYKLCADWFLDYHNLCLDKQHMMYDRNNYGVKYVYIPTKEMLHTDEEISKFFQNFVVNIEVTDDTSYPMKLLRILMSGAATPLQLLDVIAEEDNSTEEKAAPQTATPTAADMINQGMETVGKFVDNSVKWAENVAKPEIQGKMEEVANKAGKQGFGFLKGNKKAEPAPETVISPVTPVTPAPTGIKTDIPAPSRPGAEFGKVEVGGDIMGNLFGDNPVEEKSGKNKKEKPKKEPKEAKEGGLFGGIFGGKKADKKDEAIDISSLMGGSQSGQIQQPVANTPVMPTPRVQTPPPAPVNYTPAAAYAGDDVTMVFDDNVYVNDNVVRFQLDNGSGYQLPSMIEIDMSKGFATVGRFDKTGRGQCDFNFDASMSFVSRTHLRLEKTNDVVQIIDLNSANGTFVNGTQIVPNIPYTISKGDLIRFSSKITYKML